MNDRSFGNPIFVSDGPALIREIASIGDALDFLHEWPETERDMKFETVLDACHRAHDNHAPTFMAREAFRKWASSANILEDGPSVQPWMAARLSGSGGIPT